MNDQDDYPDLKTHPERIPGDGVEYGEPGWFDFPPPNDRQCGERSPTGRYVCTRSEGHDGDHAAHAPADGDRLRAFVDAHTEATLAVTVLGSAHATSKAACLAAAKLLNVVARWAQILN